MTCMTAFVESTAMATTQLARVIRHKGDDWWQLETNDARKPRMSWVVVIDKDGRRRLQIFWSCQESNDE
jgi:hypothetical protein